jgi:transposase
MAGSNAVRAIESDRLRVGQAKRVVTREGWYYSPDLNPIELAFSKLKRLLRDAAERSVEALWQTIGRMLGRFTPAECANYIRHCRFAQSGR